VAVFILRHSRLISYDDPKRPGEDSRGKTKKRKTKNMKTKEKTKKNL